MGRIPKPALAVLTNACNTYIKWAEIWERMLPHARCSRSTCPGSRSAGQPTRPGDPDFERDRALRASAAPRADRAAASRSPASSFDIDRLREALGHANAMSAAWQRVLELNRSAPGAVQRAHGRHDLPRRRQRACAARAEGAALLRATWSRRWSTRRRTASARSPTSSTGCCSSACPAIRSSAASTRCSPNWGGVFVSSTYLWFASGGADLRLRVRPARPLESLAEGVLIGVRHAMDSMFFQDARAGRDDRDLRRRRRRLSPDQELPHRLHRPGRQPRAR